MDPIKDYIRSSIDELSKKEYGWDGGEALPIRQDVRSTALNRFSGDNGSNLSGTHVDSVSLNADGTVEIVFLHAGRELYLTFRCDHVVTYVKLYPSGATEEGTIRIAFQDSVREFYGLLRWAGAKD
jgi:5-methylcytosine-specific restriction endonuclease McrBC GTP-binding regulatory subunit McrB